MQAAAQNEIYEVISAHDSAACDDSSVEAADVSGLLDALEVYFAPREFQTTVVGVDIYQYSRMRREVQRVMPFLFEFMRRGVSHFCKDETMVFSKEEQDQLGSRFIPTGDGGFQLVATPLHALVFVVLMQMFVVLFNGFRMFPKLRATAGPLSLRYAITSGEVFAKDGNFFGPAVIRNARILSRDALNRCLVDQATVEWFNQHTTNIESVAEYTTADVLRIPGFETRTDTGKSALFASTRPELPFRTITLQRLKTLQAKESVIEIYSLYAQLGMTWTNSKTQVRHPLIVTVGNLNPEGIAV